MAIVAPQRDGSWSVRERSLAALLVVLSLSLNLCVLDHGKPGPFDRNGDALHPMYTLGLAPGVDGGPTITALKYPPLVPRLVGAVQRLWLVAHDGSGAVESLHRRAVERTAAVARQGVDAFDRDPLARTIGELIVVGRGVVALFGGLAVLAVILLARELFGAPAGLIAGLLAALNATLVHYAHQVNVDVPYVALAIVALWLAARAARHGSQVDLALAACVAALSVGAKDQAYALFVLAIPAAIALFMRPGAQAPGTRRPFPWRAVAVGSLAAAATWLLLPGLPIDWHWHLEHVRHLLGRGSQPFRTFSADASGWLELLHAMALLIGDGLGPPLAIFAAGATIAMSWRSGAKRRRMLILVAPLVSYFLFFLVPIGYVYLRFTLPLQLLLTVAAAAAIAAAIESRRFRIPAALLLGLAVAWNVHSTFGVLRLLGSTDTRERGESWLREHYTPETRVDAVLARSGIEMRLPRRPTLRVFQPSRPPAPGSAPPDVVIVSWFYGDLPRTDSARSWDHDESIVWRGARYRLEKSFEPELRHWILRSVLLHPFVLFYGRVE